MRSSSSSSSQPLHYSGHASGAARYHSRAERDLGSEAHVPLTLGSRRSSATTEAYISRGGQLPSNLTAAYPIVGGAAPASTSSALTVSLEDDEDDWLHDPSKPDGLQHDFFSFRGIANYLTLGLLLGALLMLFGGYPILVWARSHQPKTRGAFNLGGVNASGQAPVVIGNFGLVDANTPRDAYTMVTQTGETWDLVFSDEFDTPGRTFWPGDDPYWEAQDLHAWSTNDLEYYSPAAVTTVPDPDDESNGFLRLTLSNITTHDLYHQGGEISSWNKFCFTGGRIEASVRLPGRPDVYGLWPAIWTMGNLGRVGYGGTLEGTWPYSYDACDAGTLPNQTLPDGTPAILRTGNQWNEPLSYLPGQRLSACTCPDDGTHPGPKKADGIWKGRGAPEIDLIEPQVDHDSLRGEVSQSSQYAPFNLRYRWLNDTNDNAHFYDPTISRLNSYSGGQYQMSTSGLTETNQLCYEYAPGGGRHTGCFSVFAFEYEPGLDGYITWFSDDKPSWTVKADGMRAQPEIDISARPVPEEPLYIIINHAISYSFTSIDWENLLPLFPLAMDVDYIRVYQDPMKRNIGCDPEDFPTADYIARYREGYENSNLTTWAQLTDNAPLPANRLLGGC